MALISAGGDSVENPIGFIRSSTPQLRALVAEQRSALTPAAFEEFIGRVRDRFDKCTADLAAAPAGAPRGRVLEEMMSDVIASVPLVAVSCKKGCYGCCHSEVEITADEADVLRDKVLGGIDIDLDRLEVQAARERLSPSWTKFWSVENRCVFLSAEGACRVYEDRPAVCRRLLVTTPPEACTIEYAAIAPVHILLAEILLSAAISLNNTGCSSLPKLLLASLRR